MLGVVLLSLDTLLQINFDTQDGTTGGLHFSLGVFANGTPMSPDTLVLPSSVDNLPTNVVDAAMRVPGQAWSVATASGTLPAGVIPTSRSMAQEGNSGEN